MTQSSSQFTVPDGKRATGTTLVGSPIVWITLAAWLAATTWLAAQGMFSAAPGELPLPMLGAAGAPPMIFLAAYLAVPAVKRWVQSLDLAELVALQSWRIIGAAFLFAWGTNVLPPIFAFPAGIGDIVVGLAAPAAALAVSRNLDHAPVAAWGVFAAGMTDFIIVVPLGLLALDGMPLHLPGHLSTTAMDQAPFVLFPVFLVPAFIILHIMAAAKLLNR